MRTSVSDKGVVIPKEYFGKAKVVEIYEESDKIVVKPIIKEDSLSNLGRKPIKCGIKKASADHDLHLAKSR